jgi:hypothetical protein
VVAKLDRLLLHVPLAYLPNLRRDQH